MLRSQLTALSSSAGGCLLPVFDGLTDGLDVDHSVALSVDADPCCLELAWRLQLGRSVRCQFVLGPHVAEEGIGLELLSLFERLWASHSLSLRAAHYNCVATGAGQGLKVLPRQCVPLCSVSLCVVVEDARPPPIKSHGRVVCRPMTR
mgnify:CR=1 FL=1